MKSESFWNDKYNQNDKCGLRKNKYDSRSIFLIFISFFGLLFLTAMYLWSPPFRTSLFIQESLILLIFAGICISGMVVAIYPSTCQGLIKFQSKVKDASEKSNLIQDNVPVIPDNMLVIPDNVLDTTNIIFKGHHPDCGKFKHHVFKFRGKKYCPGCSGLFIGAALAVIGTLIYLGGLTFMGVTYTGLASLYGQLFFPLGVVMVFLALSLIVFLNMEKKLKFTANIALVLGSFLILIGIVEVKGNLLMEIYFLIMVIFWIITRINVSESYHEIICWDCQRKSVCIYEK